MRNNRNIGAPYETLSDLAIGSLGVFIILVVVLVIVSSFSKGENNKSKIVIDKNQEISTEIERINKRYSEQKDSTKEEINHLNAEYRKSRAQLEDRKSELQKNKRQLKNNKDRLDELNSAVEVLDQRKNAHADYLVELDKMEIQLASLVDYNTGSGVDKTGRPHLNYGTFTPDYYSASKDTLFLIGKEGVLTKKQFYGLLKSFKHEGETSFFIQFSCCNSRYKQDSYEPEWSKDLWKKAGWKTTDVPKKDGY